MIYTLGELDQLTIIPTCFGTIIGIMAIIGFGYTGQRADIIAKVTAEKVAGQLAPTEKTYLV